MIVVLRKEVLYQKNEKVIYKSYNLINDTYGMWMPIPEGALKYKAVFLHIFPYNENKKAAVITELGEYKWVDLKWKMSEMTKEEKEEWSSYQVKDSKCICNGEPKSGKCIYCKGGIIYNSYGYNYSNSGLD